MPLPKTKRGEYARLRNRTNMICGIMTRHGVKWRQAMRMLTLMDQGCKINEAGMVYYDRWNGGMVVNPTTMKDKGFKPRDYGKDGGPRRKRTMVPVEGGNV